MPSPCSDACPSPQRRERQAAMDHAIRRGGAGLHDARPSQGSVCLIDLTMRKRAIRLFTARLTLCCMFAVARSYGCMGPAAAAAMPTICPNSHTLGPSACPVRTSTPRMGCVSQDVGTLCPSPHSPNAGWPRMFFRFITLQLHPTTRALHTSLLAPTTLGLSVACACTDQAEPRTG